MTWRSSALIWQSERVTGTESDWNTRHFNGGAKIPGEFVLSGIQPLRSVEFGTAKPVKNTDYQKTFDFALESLKGRSEETDAPGFEHDV